MSDKVKLPREVATAIDTVWFSYDKDAFTKHMVLTNWSMLKEDHASDYNELSSYAYSYPINYMSALVNGYEVEETPEDKVRNYYNDLQIQFPNSHAAQSADTVVIVLDMLNIKIKGVNA